MTPHNEAKKEDIAKIVLMPGDPLRAKYIAENFLENARLVNTIRGMFAYTGTYKGIKITSMASGMGIPSTGIYSYELYKFYDVDSIIRIGTCGGFKETLKLFDLIVVDKVYSESTYAKLQNGATYNNIKASESLNEKIIKTAANLDMPIILGDIECTDVFYAQKEYDKNQYKEKGLLACEMESFALFHNAKVLNKKAACLLTVSNLRFADLKETTAKERETSLNNMIKLALETAIKM